jgi:ABC-type transport system involved in multi-copper enzyme maturation permease subunit
MNIQIIKKELLSNLQSFRFSAILIITTALFIMNGLIFNGVYEERLSNYSKNLEQHGIFRTIDLLRNGIFYVEKKPGPLLFCVEGGEAELPFTLLGESNGIIRGFYFREQNFTLPRFEEIDWAFIVKILFSLFAIILTYDAISGEKERGTLALILANSIPRASIILSKYLAAFVTILIPLAIGMLVGLLSLRGDVIALDSQSWWRIVVFALMSIVYISLFIFLGLFISSLSHRSSISLLLLLAVWMSFVIVIPTSSGLLAEQFSKVPGEFDFVKQRERIMYSWDRQEFEKRIKAKGLKLTIGNEPSEEMKAEALKVINETGERVYNLTDKYERSIHARFSLARNIARISPSAVFQYTGEAVADSGIFRQRRYEKAARDYYGVWRSYVQEKGVPFIKYPYPRAGVNYARRGFQVEIDGKEVTIPIQLPQPKGDLYKIKDAPVFQEPEPSIISSLSEAIANILILILWNVAFLLLAHIAFMRYDVT